MGFCEYVATPVMLRLSIWLPSVAKSVTFPVTTGFTSEEVVGIQGADWTVQCIC